MDALRFVRSTLRDRVLYAAVFGVDFYRVELRDGFWRATFEHAISRDAVAHLGYYLSLADAIWACGVDAVARLPRVRT